MKRYLLMLLVVAVCGIGFAGSLVADQSIQAIGLGMASNNRLALSYLDEQENSFLRSDRVRQVTLFGVTIPGELNNGHPDRLQECYSRQALETLNLMVQDQQLLVEIVRNGALPEAVVYQSNVSGLSINERMVLVGAAFAKDSEFEALEARARQAGDGRWSHCPLKITYIDPQAELVAILNVSNQPVELKGWKLHSSTYESLKNWNCPFDFCTDVAKVGQTWEMPLHCDIPPGGVVEVVAHNEDFLIGECGTSKLKMIGNFLGRTSGVWHDSGDLAWLISPQDEIAWWCEYSGKHQVQC